MRTINLKDNHSSGKLIKTNIYNKDSNRTSYVDAKEFQKEMESNRFLLTTVYEFTGGECGIFKEVQMHPVTGEVLHLDVFILDTGKNIKLNIKLKVHNKDICEGLKAGGVLKLHSNNFNIDCLPKDAVNKIDIDIAKLQINEKITTDDLNLPNIRFVKPGTIISISEPKRTKK